MKELGSTSMAEAEAKDIARRLQAIGVATEDAAAALRHLGAAMLTLDEQHPELQQLLHARRGRGPILSS